MKEIKIYVLFITYSDYTQELDNIFVTPEAAEAHAKKLINHGDVIRAAAMEAVVNDEFGYTCKRTVYSETKQALD